MLGDKADLISFSHRPLIIRVDYALGRGSGGEAGGRAIDKRRNASFRDDTRSARARVSELRALKIIP
jgi:hypothetical protein